VPRYEPEGTPKTPTRSRAVRIDESLNAPPLPPSNASLDQIAARNFFLEGAFVLPLVLMRVKQNESPYPCLASKMRSFRRGRVSSPLRFFSSCFMTPTSTRAPHLNMTETLGFFSDGADAVRSDDGDGFPPRKRAFLVFFGPLSFLSFRDTASAAPPKRLSRRTMNYDRPPSSLSAPIGQTLAVFLCEMVGLFVEVNQRRTVCRPSSPLPCGRGCPYARRVFVYVMLRTPHFAALPSPKGRRIQSRIC